MSLHPREWPAAHVLCAADDAIRWLLATHELEPQGELGEAELAQARLALAEMLLATRPQKPGQRSG